MVGVGTSFATADSGTASGFGLGNAIAAENVAPVSALGEAGDTALNETSQLASSTARDISTGIEAIEAKEEADRIAAEEAKRAEEAARQAEVAARQAEQQVTMPTTGNLTEVDWTVGKDAFIAEWTARIDAYLAGSPLAGQGVTFATAAWEYGVDPRFSPAISNTESSKGSICFLPYNAWGWGNVGFSSWEEAIYTHVAGLAAGYGYTLSYEGAMKYCPPNYHNWFYNTLSEMQRI